MFKAFGKLYTWFLPSRSRAARNSLQANALTAAFSEKKFDFARFEQLLGYHPKNWNLFFESLLHRSYLQYLGHEVKSNERLEFTEEGCYGRIEFAICIKGCA